MILVLADPTDRLAVDLMTRLERSGIAAHRAGPDNWNALRFSWELPGEVQGHVVCGDRRVALNEISGVLVRALPVVTGLSYKETDDEYLLMEWNAALLGFLKALPCPVINRPRPGRHFRQPLLTAFAPALEKAGFLLPDLLVTASPQEARDFLRVNPTAMMVPPDGESRRLESGVAPPLPSCLIAVPDGAHWNVIIVGQQVFCTQPLSQLLSRSCVAAMQALELGFAALSVISNSGGDWLIELDERPRIESLPSSVRSPAIDALAALLKGKRP
ncbi:MAG TPA: hypothetical protein VHZ32_05115 [Rhizomicrobium sp.]|nr:hypothetical protein [Rhizomicrobium sp.]